jgi:signal transduction histidine kinase
MFSNIASCYNNINNTDSAFYFINIALDRSRRAQNLTILANALNIRAAIYISLAKYKEAEVDLREALGIRKKIGDAMYITADLAQLSFFYADMGATDKGIAAAKEGIRMAHIIQNTSKLIFIYKALAYNYKKADLFEDYAATLEKIIELKDTLSKKNADDAISVLEAKYEIQKQENIILQQKSRLYKNKIVTWAILIGACFMTLSAWLGYRNYKHLQARKLKDAVNQEKQNTVMAIQQAEENERKRIAADLHDNLGSYAAAIKANAREIKVFHPELQASSQIEENAEQMVTQLGETIWVLKNEELRLTDIADRFKVWIQRLLLNYPHIKYYYQESIEVDHAYSPNQTLDLFLILKECVTNAIKHSNGTELKIIFYSNENVVLTIQDNGSGFDMNAITQSSGINNVIKRATNFNYFVDWKSNQSGTKVSISSTIN